MGNAPRTCKLEGPGPGSDTRHGVDRALWAALETARGMFCAGDRVAVCVDDRERRLALHLARDTLGIAGVEAGDEGLVVTEARFKESWNALKGRGSAGEGARETE